MPRRAYESALAVTPPRASVSPNSCIPLRHEGCLQPAERPLSSSFVGSGLKFMTSARSSSPMTFGFSGVTFWDEPWVEGNCDHRSPTRQLESRVVDHSAMSAAMSADRSVR